MASNNDTREKEQITVIDGDSSHSSTSVIVARGLSLRNILHNFPEILLNILPFIADRTVFNSIASCNRDTHEKSKEISPPWPNDYRLPGCSFRSIAAWSPDGTRVAYRCNSVLGAGDVITITDQRYGIIHQINYNGSSFCYLQFSPDGRFLVAACHNDRIIRLWDNITGNYEQLHEWNIIQENVGRIGQHLVCNISACSKYIIVAPYASNRVVLKNVENGETIRSLTPQPVMKYITKVMFSADGLAVFICGRVGDSNVIKLWRPYLDDADEDSTITLWEQKSTNVCPKIVFSPNKMMIAIQDAITFTALDKGWLLSIDNNYSCTVQKLNFQGSEELVQFKPDDKCIIFETKNGLKYWRVADKEFIDNKYLLYNKRTTNNFKVEYCSPNNCQLIVRANNNEGGYLYMKSMSSYNHRCTKEEFNNYGERCKVLED